MIVYRIAKEKWANKLDGIGSAKNGARWNSKGIEVVYTSLSRALACLEVAVHIDYDLIPEDYKIVTINLSDNLPIFVVNDSHLGDNWKFNKKLTQRIGDLILGNDAIAIIKVPSAIIENEYNILINPNYTNIEDYTNIINIEPFNFDKRLFS